MGQFGIGQAVRRTEDLRLLTGHGRYTDDHTVAGAAHLVLLRSPHAHAEIRQIDTADAAAMPGVLAVLTAADLAHWGDLPCTVGMKNRDGSPIAKPAHPVLARGRVRHVGDPVAAVVAESVDAGRDAAERIVVDYDTLAAVVEAVDALAPGAPQVHTDVPGNRCLDWELGDAAATAAGFAQAKHVVTLELVNNRLVVASMEPRNALATHDPLSGLTTLVTGSQGSHTIRSLLAEKVLHEPAERLRVITPDVGGGFGMKIFLYAEQVLCIAAARRIGRPVRWSAERGEAFLSDTQGRDHRTRASLALDGEGRARALRVETVANLGAYLSTYAPFVATAAGASMLCGVYRLPAVHVHVEGAFTNTVPVDAYRGAGRPEAAYVIERLMDEAARQLGLDPAEIRRRNFIPPEAMPYRTALGDTYDSGAFARLLDRALEKAGWAHKATRRAEAKARGRLYGMGVAYYVEACAGGSEEQAHLRMNPDGTAALTVGTQSNGQGHETAYAQLVADSLGLPLDAVRVHQGDTDLVPFGNGTGGSRSLPVGGAAVGRAVAAVIAKGRKIAAHALEAGEADIEFRDGDFRVAGTDRTLSFVEVAKLSYRMSKLPPDMEPRLEATGMHKPAAKTYPNGAHVCALEVDPETGTVTFTGYTVVDDFGVVVNPLLVAGQVHGGVAQGIGQALQERTVYDPETGQLLTGSLMDYQLPRAGDLVPIDLEFVEVKCTTNPLGAKGCGEAGAIGAPPAVMNALLDALGAEGVTRIDMPATPAAIWNALQAARASHRP